MKWSRWSLFCSVAAILCVVALSATGATFNIADGDVTALKNAINTANGNGQNDIINLAVNGTYTLTTVDTSAGADGQTGLPVVGPDGSSAHSLTINGNNATITRSGVSGTPLMRLFASNNGTGTLTINSLKFVGGNLQQQGDGGALWLIGVTVMKNCTVSNSNADHGGGIYMEQSLTMSNCTMANNIFYHDGGAIYGALASVYNSALSGVPHIALTNCTLYNQTYLGRGDGIYVKTPSGGSSVGSQVDLLSCTLVGAGICLESRFAAYSTPPAILNVANTIVIRSDLLTPSNGNNSEGKVVSQGFNLTDRNQQLNQPTDLFADPKLDPHGLTDNGGPTQTIALGAGSPAIDNGNSFSLATDQRGSARIYDNPAIANASDGADIGAFEAGADQPQSGSPSFVVNTKADHDDGNCTGADCTLREAITEAQQFFIPVTFAPSITGTLTLTGGDVYLLSGVKINGPGARTLALSANRQSRVFNVVAGSSHITGLTIRDGLVTGGTGVSTSGGAIYNIATLELDDCAIVHSNVVGGNALNNTTNPGGAGYGGAISNSGKLSLIRCTVGGGDSNSANGAAGGKGGDRPTTDDILYHGGTGGAGFGGAIFNDAGGQLKLVNTTIAGNSATGGKGGAAAFGGKGGDSVAGIYNLGTLTALNSTLSANAAVAGAGGSSELGGGGAAGRADGGLRADTGSTNTAGISIIAGNTRNTGGAPDVSGAFTSVGFNFIGINSATGFTAVGDQTGTAAAPRDAMLGPIQNNGGPTDTMLPITGSPVIDQGGYYFDNEFDLTPDQRGFVRPMDSPVIPNATGGDGSDIGAVEADHVVAPSPTPTPTATPNPTATPTPTASPSPSPTPSRHLLNIATRLRVQTGDNVLIGGFIITGSDPKRLVIRGIGPSLAQFFSDPLSDPTLELYQGDTLLASNDNWKESQAEVEATALQPTNDLESAIVRTFVPGNYTAIVRGNGNSTGIGVVEAYDLSPSANSKLANIATRGFVDTGDNVMIGGFITGGDAQIVIRAIGPSLGNFGVSGALQDPTLELVNSNGGIIRSNNDWKEFQQNEIAATGLQPGDDRESALIENLPAGNYTAIVRGAGNSTGIGLVEIYDYH